MIYDDDDDDDDDDDGDDDDGDDDFSVIMSTLFLHSTEFWVKLLNSPFAVD